MKSTVIVNGRIVEWEDQMSIQRLLEKIKFSHRIFIVKMNNKIIKKELYLTQIVPENAVLTILPLVAGG
ncbi:sulfur carrier protein ThiS [Acidobacteriota bacterium]